MNNKLVGSDLARVMLSRGDEQVWCAVSNESDQQANITINNHDYSCIQRIVSFSDGYFLCNKGNSWTCAVPVKRIVRCQSKVGL